MTESERAISDFLEGWGRAVSLLRVGMYISELHPTHSAGPHWSPKALCQELVLVADITGPPDPLIQGSRWSDLES